jgi:hypothetical protein
MASNINPNNIDTTYPVAGQDNSTQGFRDNFTNIKTNFQYTETEINDLQNKVLLKSALLGSSLNNNMAGALLSGARIQNFSATRVQVTASGSPLTAIINYAAGHYQTLTITGSTTLSFTGWPAAGSYGLIKLELDISNTAHTVTLPPQVNVNTSGITGLNQSTGEITFAAVGKYSFEFETYQGGSSITVSQTNQTLQSLNNSSEDLADASAASLAVTTSYFTTAAAETATLAAGVEGQIKVFALRGTSGDMVITVSNAGWKTSGSGTITFDTIGNACTLQYISGKWFCIGNNGCVFA